ncbi:MAG: sensor histidine kinase, partial [Bacillales bacterium]|nr:sensor histidine kinase [Bacillales bacterium]
IVYNYEEYFSRIIEVSNSVSKYIDRVNPHDSLQDTLYYFQTIKETSYEVIDISLYDMSGDNIVTTNSNLSFNYQEEEFFTQALASPTIHSFSIPDSENNFLIIISKVVTFNKTTESGVLKIDINFENIVELSQKSNLGNKGHLYIINANYQKVFSSVNDLFEDEIDLLKDIVLGNKTYKINGSTFQVSLETLSNTKLRIGVFIDVTAIQQTQSDYYKNLFIFSALFIILASLVSYLIISRAIKPMNRLKTIMEQYSIDNLVIDTNNFNSSKEVFAMANSFKIMTQRIEELMIKVYVEQLEQKKSELKALQNQINPHFLYNTLDTIVWMIENENKENASEMVIALAKLFRISISKGKNIISLESEIEHAKNYLLIQNIRFNKTFSYDFEYDESIITLQVMKLLLQPIIENSIIHGMKNTTENGKIKIKISADAENITFEVKDNGFGMSSEKVQELYASLDDYNATSGIGLRNTFQRLKLYYSGKAKFIIESQLDEGTTITIIVPKEVEDEKSNLF